MDLLYELIKPAVMNDSRCLDHVHRAPSSRRLPSQL